MQNKLKILTESAKYDVACTSSGSSRQSVKGKLGNTVLAGICHSFSSDGRCISLLKVLQSNYCVYNCQYCVNRKDNDIERAAFTSQELSDLVISFYKRNYIEGLFLSSAVIKSPDHTMELMYETVRLLREKENFNGYIHMKAIPGADQRLIDLCGYLVDRMSVNIELPSEKSLNIFAPDKSKDSILRPMKQLNNNILNNKNELKLYKHAEKYIPAGQSTQMIVGASDDSDSQIVGLAESMYNKFALKRVFYSAYIPVANSNSLLPIKPPPLGREHRLYQADWLMRFYGFKSAEILDTNENLSLDFDPKAQWALRNLQNFPIEVNKADYYDLLRVPGLGPTSAKRIVASRRYGKLDFDTLKKIGVVLKRAKYFLTCDGKSYERYIYTKEFLSLRLIEKSPFEQVNLFDTNGFVPRISKKEKENV